MPYKRMLSTVAVVLLALAVAMPALAGQVNMRKIKKWPALDQAWARSFDAWMSDEELDVFIKIRSTDERRDFLTQAGYFKKWKKIDEEMLPHVIKGEVVKGMNKDEVYMCWDKPEKIRKDFRRDAYVNVLNYAFERDKKGREFVMRPDSQTAYKNENFIRFVYMFNGEVFAIVDEGDEENVMEELPGQDPPEETTPAPAPEESATEGEDTPQADPAPDSK